MVFEFQKKKGIKNLGEGRQRTENENEAGNWVLQSRRLASSGLQEVTQFRRRASETNL